MKHKTIVFALLGITAIAGASFILCMPPIPQSPVYHQFSDTHHYCGIANFWNVISNLPFLIVGWFGIYKTRMKLKNSLPHQVFFASIACVAIGSAYYHLNPNNQTLVWDRLPMTLAFMSLLSILIGQFIQAKAGRLLLIPLLLLGIFSLVYWLLFKDLRCYVFVQFYPMLVFPIVLLFVGWSKSTRPYWVLLLAYLLAKLCEHFDSAIHHHLLFISGHSLKHLVAAAGIYYWQKHLLLTENSSFDKSMVNE
ncbi:MAG: ceramidase domain-containing protein [Bacteroidia bacterium]|nr:ceramidase domain-containing protein [Bacteroidia bacterium]